MPKTYSEGHKAREITLAEAAIVKLIGDQGKAKDRYAEQNQKAIDLRARAAGISNKAEAVLQAGDWDRKIDAAEAHLAWLRAMPVPPADEVPS